jgi:2-amino-4-hydroxy-6-hydroxymethyldihydropteridine diphosphokinase|tara:strand:- start:23 stop:472 length:450 start_codon:yes stop_codon:yes gene_type:complete
MHQVYVSIGSNIDPNKNITIVKGYLNGLFDCTFSSLYETISEGFEGNNFINCVVGFETDIEPIALRENLKKIEKNMGRTLSQKGMSNRVIDLDLILYGNLITEDKNFDIPSKGIENMAFILEPLAEIAGDLKHPISKISFSLMLKHLRS